MPTRVMWGLLKPSPRTEGILHKETTDWVNAPGPNGHGSCHSCSNQRGLQCLQEEIAGPRAAKHGWEHKALGRLAGLSGFTTLRVASSIGHAGRAVAPERAARAHSPSTHRVTWHWATQRDDAGPARVLLRPPQSHVAGRRTLITQCPAPRRRSRPAPPPPPRRVLLSKMAAPGALPPRPPPPPPPLL